MQTARIWFARDGADMSLPRAKSLLEAAGARVEETAWRLEGLVVPQLHVLTPVPLLLQLNEDDDVIEEAEEFAALPEVPEALRPALARCDARLEIGGEAENPDVAATGPDFDPGAPAARRLLAPLVAALGGVFEDNVSGGFFDAQGLGAAG